MAQASEGLGASPGSALYQLQDHETFSHLWDGRCLL